MSPPSLNPVEFVRPTDGVVTINYCLKTPTELYLCNRQKNKNKNEHSVYYDYFFGTSQYTFLQC